MRVLLTLTLAVIVVGCTTGADEAAESVSATVVDPESFVADARPGTLCEAAEQIRDLDDHANGILNEVMLSNAGADRATVDAAFREAMAEITVLLPDLQEAYERLADAVPEDAVADVAHLQHVTLSAFAQMADVESVDDIESQLMTGLSEADLAEAIQATLRLDQITRDECGVVIAD